MSNNDPKPTASTSEQPHLSGYDTVTDRLRELHGIDVSVRQFKGWVWAGKVSHLRVGNRTMFTDEHLHELVESMTVKAVR